MGKVIDYFDYLKGQNDAATVNKTVAFVSVVHPQIEAIILGELARMYPDDTSKRASFDEAVVASLCFILSNYLAELTSRPNSFNVNEENIGGFVNDLISNMLKTMKRKETDDTK